MQQTIPDIISHIDTLATVHILPPYLYQKNRERTGTFYILDNNRHPFILPYLHEIEKEESKKNEKIKLLIIHEVGVWGIGCWLWLNVERVKGSKTVELEPTLYICPHTRADGLKRKEAVKIPFPTTTGLIYNVIHQLPTIGQYFYLATENPNP